VNVEILIEQTISFRLGLVCADLLVYKTETADWEHGHDANTAFAERLCGSS